MAWLQYRFQFALKDEETLDILIARLSESGFEAFWQDENELIAYAEEKFLETGSLEEILKAPVFSHLSLIYQVDLIAEKNWNEEWEKSYPPVFVEDICTIIAPFHSRPQKGASLLIEPKMSFGTGHHQTTRLMIRQIYSTNVQNFQVLDVGCGTGVLGIFSLNQGAEYVTAIDIDPWACENSKENFLRNGYLEDQFEVIQGDAGKIPDAHYDLILANINRNILVADMPVYSARLKKEGILILSGILSSDEAYILEAAQRVSLHKIASIFEDSWISVKLTS